MPKRFRKRDFRVPAAAQNESFEPYWIAILVIVMATFTIYGIQSITLAVQAMGPDKVASCFIESKEAVYHRFLNCTNHTI